MQLSQITPVVITLNEAVNIRVLLDSLAAFPQVVVVDSHSTDSTQEVVKRYPNTTLWMRDFDDFASQWNHAIDHAATDWIFALDADYRLSRETLKELQSLVDAPDVEGYMVPFKYSIYGRVLRCGIYPPRVILFRRSKIRFVNDGHSQALLPQGKVLAIQSAVVHDDQKDMGRWLENQIVYGKKERDKLLSTKAQELTLPDRLRLLFPLAPFAMLAYVLVIRRGLLDGWPGVFYALQRFVAELIIGLFILEARLITALKPIEKTR